jgi:hypothetical protein
MSGKDFRRDAQHGSEPLALVGVYFGPFTSCAMIIVSETAERKERSSWR